MLLASGLMASEVNCEDCGLVQQLERSEWRVALLNGNVLTETGERAACHGAARDRGAVQGMGNHRVARVADARGWGV